MHIIQSALIVVTGSINAQTWTQKGDFGGTGRYSAAGFSIGNNGYIGLGGDTALVIKQDFWQWNQSADSWIQKADYPGGASSGTVGFSIGNKGYVAIYNTTYNFWEYDPGSDTWAQKAHFPGGVVGSASFSIGTKGYIATGVYSQTLWEWDGDTSSSAYNTWVKKANFPLLAGRYGAAGFSIGTKGYIGTGTDGHAFKQDLWEWDGDTTSATYDTWTQKASMPGMARTNAVGFSIGTHGYIGTGIDIHGELNLKDFWQWDQETDTWTQMPDLPGPGRQSAVAFSIGNNGYIGTGYGGFGHKNLRDFWEFCDTNYVGFNEPANTQNILIYPNPANNHLYIRNPDLTENSIAEIFNIYGNLVFSKTFKGSIGLDISSLSGGLYIIKIKNNRIIYSTKLIIGK